MTTVKLDRAEVVEACSMYVRWKLGLEPGLIGGVLVHTTDGRLRTIEVEVLERSGSPTSGSVYRKAGA